MNAPSLFSRWFPLPSARRVASTTLGVVLGVTLASSARADDAPKAPGYQRTETTKEYVAPLSQATQPSYVPQSVALSGPSEIDHEDGMAVPPGYTPVERRRKGPIIGGAVTFGVLYSFSLLGAAAGADSNRGSDNPNAALYVPVVGPFIQLFKTDTEVGRVFLAIDGIGQSAGMALLVYGLTSPKTVLVRNDLTGASVHLTPMVTGSTTGLGLGGTF